MTGSELDILAAKIAERIAVQPRWLKLKQAAVYASIGKGELLELIRQGEIDGFQDLEKGTKPWIIDKKSIDKYRVSQMRSYRSESREDEEFVLDMMKGLDI